MEINSILDLIEIQRAAKGLTRKDVARLMGEGWTKEKLDKVFQVRTSIPRAETLARMMEALGMPTYPPELFKTGTGNGESSNEP